MVPNLENYHQGHFYTYLHLHAVAKMITITKTICRFSKIDFFLINNESSLEPCFGVNECIPVCYCNFNNTKPRVGWCEYNHN